jgi:hypothetical protein
MSIYFDYCDFEKNVLRVSNESENVTHPFKISFGKHNGDCGYLLIGLKIFASNAGLRGWEGSDG